MILKQNCIDKELMAKRDLEVAAVENQTLRDKHARIILGREGGREG